MNQSLKAPKPYIICRYESCFINGNPNIKVHYFSFYYLTAWKYGDSFVYTHNSILDFEAQSSMDNKKWGIYGGRVQIGMGDYKSVPYPVFQKLLKDILELDSLNTHHAGYAESLVRLFQKHKIKKLRGYKQVKEFEKKLNEMEKLRAEIFEKQQQLKRQG